MKAELYSFVKICKQCLTQFRLKRDRIVKPAFFFILLVFFQGCLTGRNGSMQRSEAFEWEMLKQDNRQSPPEWISYSRKKRGSKFKEFKIVGLINLPPKEAVEALREKTENSHKYIKEKEGFIEVFSSTKDEIVAYSVYNLPFPLRDREMCERFKFTENGETGAFKITWEEDWSVAPPKSRGAVRMPIVRGRWEFIPEGTGKSMATYIVHAEPGGIIPAWMVNSTVGKGLPKELENIEKIAVTLK